jgi:hypothetical protein
MINRLRHRDSLTLQPQQSPPPQGKIAFQEEREVVATKGLKIRNRSADDEERMKEERANYRSRFDNLVDKTIEFQKDKEKKAVSAVTRFLQMCNDKTLPKNKGMVGLDVEREIRQELIQVAIDLNNDPTEEQDGMGSVTLISALCKVLLTQRDRLNQVEYDLQQLQKGFRSRGTEAEVTGVSGSKQ